MDKTVQAVLKKSEVRLMQGPAPEAAAPGAAGPQARIVAQTDTEAVVEVTCECGRKTRIRCTYPRQGGG